MRNEFEDYQKAIKNCKNDVFGGGCMEFCGWRENGCCELSLNELAFLSLQKLGFDVTNNFSIKDLPMILYKLANTQVKQKALVSGSFDPFTTGHLAVVEQASKLFDEVHVVHFINSAKKRTYDIDKMLDAIKETLSLKGITNCIVTKDDGLLSRYCQRNGIQTNVRGLRNVKDYNYEEELSTVNDLFNDDLKTIYFRGGSNQISSTTVKELIRYHEDVSMFVPEPVLNLIKEEM